ncbi:PP2C family protein-serine/threonine phosphatase [Gaopeijia maritima]|uniref:Protein phosphatase 2C domain-containing protein n=1 Tax=Gaopeijia maritima TaxID=3119007 RepID=A0ABU9E9H1_9BACT
MTVGPTTNGWHVALRTDAGARDGNEDSVLSMRLANGSLVVAVADGMGGLELGDVASRTALEALRNEMTRGGSLADAVRKANAAVHERAGGRPMGTTLVAAHAVGHRVTVANVGDSRAYRLTPLGIRRISIDHTHAEEARRAGGGGAEGIVTGRWSATLTRSLGGRPEVEVDVFGPIEMDDGEGLLLCSDGVHGVLADGRIESWSQSLGDPDRAVSALVDLAISSGSEDNVSAVLLHRPARSAAEPHPVSARRGPAWDPRVLVERSPVQSRKSGGRRARVLGALGLVAILAAVATWFVMR